jgi:hypothetical protein
MVRLPRFDPIETTFPALTFTHRAAILNLRLFSRGEGVTGKR